jgi:hypothetical protein
MVVKSMRVNDWEEALDSRLLYRYLQGIDKRSI